MTCRATRRRLLLARRTNPRRFTPGVYRYGSIEEMNQADDARLEEHIAERTRNRGGEHR